MKMRLKRVMLPLAAAVVLLAADKPDAAQVMFEAAKKKEIVDGDLKAAIAQYKAIAEKHAANRAVAARALMRMAECHQKLGDSEARRIYERLVRDYADQNEIASTARTRLGGSVVASSGGVTIRQVWAGRGVDGGGSPSPDDRYLTFVNWDTGDLGVRDLASRTNRLLTHTGGWAASGDYAQRSVISPDSRMAAYTWWVQKESRNEIRVIAINGAEGTQPRIIYRSANGRDYVDPWGWFPDGKRLLVVHSPGDGSSRISVMSLADGSMQTIKSLTWERPNPSLSPDGRFIAYVAPAGDTGSQRDIFVLATDGTSDTPVVQHPAQDGAPMWSPDGSRLIFVSLRTGGVALWSVPVTAGKPAGPAELVKADVGLASPLGFTRAGSLYYALSGAQKQNVLIAALDDSLHAVHEPAPATQRFVNSTFGPAWSRDGEWLAYYTAASPGAVKLWIRAMKTGQEREVPLDIQPTTIFNDGPKWGPDGRYVYVQTARGGSRQRQIYRVELASGKAELVHTVSGQGFSSWAVSPDGKSIFYCLQNDGTGVKEPSGKLVRYDLGSADPVVLKKDRWFIALAISPDGKQLAYLESSRAADSWPSSVSVMPAAGGEARQVFGRPNWGGGSRYNTLAWSPDQRYLVFAIEDEDYSGGPQSLWRAPVAGGPAEKMGITMAARIKSPSIHPDGRRIVFGTMHADSGEIWAMENFLPALTAKK